MYELHITTHFAAAHQLQMVSQKCENLHGHNWKIEVFLRGAQLDEAGVLIDFGVVKGYLAEVIGSLDHRFLNDHEWFTDRVPPSSENIARYVADALQKKLAGTGIAVSRVKAWESENCAAAYLLDA